ncbi:MAG: hypothetical protein PSV24_13050 [Rhodoferax sp.]|nr:hypothetical protein [Rhodoferax sp.]
MAQEMGARLGPRQILL